MRIDPTMMATPIGVDQDARDHSRLVDAAQQFEALMAQEAGMLASAETVETELLGGPLIDGDRVAIRWRFSFVFKNGHSMRQEEIAWQTWRGDKIAEETFFYDPAQRGR